MESCISDLQNQKALSYWNNFVCLIQNDTQSLKNAESSFF